MKKDILNKTLNFIFSKSNIKYIFLLVIIGFILRLFAVTRLEPSPDEFHFIVHAIDIIKTKVLEIMDESPLWFQLTDLSYIFFGINIISARLIGFLTGSLSIIVIYLITKETFTKKTALIASILLTFSSYHIIFSTTIDSAMLFFILVSTYFLIKGLKENKESQFILATLFYSLAVLTKTIALVFIAPFILFSIYYYYKNDKKIKINKKSLQIIFILAIIFVISMLPILTHNYLLYKDKKLLDLQFSRFLGIGGEVYKPIEQTLNPFKISNLFKFGTSGSGILVGLNFFLKYDLLISLLAILGIPIAYKKRKEWTIFLGLWFIFSFIFLAGTSLLPNHFLFGIIPLCILSSNSIIFLKNKISDIIKVNKKVILTLLLVIIISVNLITISKRGVFSEKDETMELKEYTDNLPKDSLIIIDSRVYRGRIAWTFNNNHYIETSYIADLINNMENLPGQLIPIKTYFIECAIDDCGWGSVDKEFNKSVENMIISFKNISIETKVIYDNGKPYYIIYETTLNLKESIFSVVDSTHEFMFYPVRYQPEEKIFDKYEIKTTYDRILHTFSYYILKLEVIMAILSFFFIIYLAIKNYKEDNKE